MKTRTATVSERTASEITVRDIRTTIKPFATGQAAFNWVRKFDADNVTVLVRGHRRANAMTIRRVGDHYEGR